VTVIPWAGVVRMCDTAAAVLAPPYGRPTASMSLLARLKEAGGPDDAKLMVSALRAALGVPARANGADVYSLPAGTTGGHVRARLLRYLTCVLDMRLKDAAVAGPVQAGAVVELFQPDDAAAAQVAAEVAAAIAGEPDPRPAPPAPAAAASRPPRQPHEWHTADGYRELLQGARVRVGGREVPGFTPPPLACLERVCADTLAALRPPTSPAQPIRRGQFLQVLYKGVEPLGLAGHQNHVKRAVDLLLLCYGLSEDGTWSCTAPSPTPSTSGSSPCPSC
jgi:uncharacterized membrane protein